MKFKLSAPYQPAGDQPKAIEQITHSLEEGNRYQTLLGVTGSGKTYTMANVIERIQRPTLVVSHNKTLCAQLYREFKEFFPENAVEYFVSYYDYYQPEAYLPATDTYIEKDASINDEIDRLRLSATSALLDRQDVIVVASVSFIYGLGSPSDFKEFVLFLRVGMQIRRRELLQKLVDMQYNREDTFFARSTFRVRGDIVEIHPAYAKYSIRLEFFGEELEKITSLELISGHVLERMDSLYLYPAKHFVTPKEKRIKAMKSIREELGPRIAELKSQNKEFEAHRLYTRTLYDLEMIQEMGYCTGVENYSRHLAGRKPGERPSTLLDYFPKDFLLVVDESHVSLSQIRGMYAGDRSRKQTLVDFGFRLPSALDNRPLRFEELEQIISQWVFLSATPNEYEKEKSKEIVEQIIRPTGLIDPSVEIRNTEGQIDDLLSEIHKRSQLDQRTLVTTLTKKMSEDLAEYLSEHGVRVRYLHSEIETIERVEILKDLRLGEFDCLVGINLLREGLDLPEVSLVAILDADKMGFLRSKTSLIQTAGRAARHVQGHVILYANRISPSMKEMISETQRRRKIQMEHNQKHSIQPKSVKKPVQDILERHMTLKYNMEEEQKQSLDLIEVIKENHKDFDPMLQELQTKMLEFAETLDFEKAAQFRDEILRLQKKKKSNRQRIKK